MIKTDILDNVGSTPMLRLKLDDLPKVELYSKLEFYNPTGSVKDRAASYIIKKLLMLGEIDKETTIIESSSGNFGIALAAYCKKNGLKFLCVIDPHVTRTNEMLIRSYGAMVLKVHEPDENGGYLLNRIRKVKECLGNIPNAYWINQYGNPYNAEAYTKTLGEEICRSMDRIDYLFLGISSGGTITGVSRRIKERFPQAMVVAVDIIGSVIFGNPPKKRYIPGIGSSMVPDILKDAIIDEVVMMDEAETILRCHQLLEKHNIFAGGSSGSSFGAIQKYFKNNPPEETVKVITIFPDRGERYTDTIYNEEWYSRFLENKPGTS